jgi:hypothetical protein
MIRDALARLVVDFAIFCAVVAGALAVAGILILLLHLIGAA